MGRALTLLAPISQNGQTYSNNPSADELFECVWPFCGRLALKGLIISEVYP